MQRQYKTNEYHDQLCNRLAKLAKDQPRYRYHALEYLHRITTSVPTDEAAVHQAADLLYQIECPW